MNNKVEIYKDGEYLENNPTWHIEDSPWKAKQIFKMIQRNDLKVNSVCEVGCGAGEVLNNLSRELPNVDFVGYEISELAYDMCKLIDNKKLNFVLGDLIENSNTEYFDILLMIDVFEHVENYFSFLRKSKSKADYKIFHIPLDLSVQFVARMAPILYLRREVGHINYFSKETALESLKDCGYEIIDFFYTDNTYHLKRSIKSKLLNLPRRFFSLFSKDLTVRYFGGSSLMVLAK